MSYVWLFLISFASATLLPGGSEALLGYLLYEQFNLFLLIGIATFGNTLGSFVNYLIGKYGIVFARKHRYIEEKSLTKASLIFKKYGAISLLFSWVPIIGDPLTVVAGVMGYPIKRFLGIVSFAKLMRYVFIYWGFLIVM